MNIRAVGAIWFNSFVMVLFAVCSAGADMGLYEMPLSMSLWCFGMGTMLANFHMCDIMLVVRAVFNMLVRNASPRWHMCFRCLMFNLSGPWSCYFSFVLFTLGPEL